MLGFWEISVLLMGALLAVGGTALWVWALIDCATKEKTEGSERVTWIIVIAVTQWIGALIYILVRRPKRIRRYGR